jgi:hypothetical protein
VSSAFNDPLSRESITPGARRRGLMGGALAAAPVLALERFTRAPRRRSYAARATESNSTA